MLRGSCFGALNILLFCSGCVLESEYNLFLVVNHLVESKIMDLVACDGNFSVFFLLFMSNSTFYRLWR